MIPTKKKMTFRKVFQFRKNSLFTIGLIAIALLWQSCYYDNEEELYQFVITKGCDTSNVTYSASVSLVMQNFCNSCHNASAPQANVVTDNYNGLKTIATNGKLSGVINHHTGFSAMPKGGPKLSDCNLAIIRLWIEKGILNN